MKRGTSICHRDEQSACFAELLEDHRGALISLGLARTGRLDAAEEIAQEVVVKAWESRGDLRDPGALRAWLFRIAINACAAWYRREERRSDLSESPGLAEPIFEQTLRRQTIREARKALSALPLKTRTAFLMNVFGYSYAEIADFLDLPPTAVRGRIARARERVRRALGARLKAALPRERNGYE